MRATSVTPTAGAENISVNTGALADRQWRRDPFITPPIGAIAASLPQNEASPTEQAIYRVGHGTTFNINSTPFYNC
eukprot:5181213-Pyramimonas_sp.AAC.1